MCHFLARNKQAAAMVAVIVAAAVVVIIIGTRSSGYIVDSNVHLKEPDDVSKNPHIFSSHSLPSDDRFMPSVGNGHIATNVFSDTVYMNGIYNGRKGESHRARIPGWANVRLNSTLHQGPYSPVYSLDTREAAFKVRVDREHSIVSQRIYAHRYYTRAIVNQIEVTSKRNLDPHIHSTIWIAVTLMPGPASKDIAFSDPIPDILEGRQVYSSCGQTLELEDPVYQSSPIDVCAYWTPVPDHLVVPHHGSTIFTFAMTADKNKTLAKMEMIKVLQESGEALYRKHVIQWDQLYNQSGVDIYGDLQLAKTVNGIWYNMLSSLPAVSPHLPNDRFFGLSPTGLARGGTFDDYEGHNFWDTEIWMFPNILLLYPSYAKLLLQYRLETAGAAADLARQSGYVGYRFPWESAATGGEVTQPCCPEVARYELHISGCVAFAARQLLAATRDDAWLQSGGCSLITNIADFWASRAVINYTTGLYDISNVMGPDEDHSNVTNSVFTNVVAGYALYLAQYVSCLSKSYYVSKDPERWADIAWSLDLPYDEVLDYHPQFSGYRRGDKIKQADAVLLGYPLLYPMNRSTLANDLRYYGEWTRSDGPALTWSMHAAGLLRMGQSDHAAPLFQEAYRGYVTEPFKGPTLTWSIHVAGLLRLGQSGHAAPLFQEAYRGYVTEPFKVWTELRRPKVGAANFLTGAGGLLQALLAGYGGIELTLENLKITVPQLPPDCQRMVIRGIHYLGAVMTLDVRPEGSSLAVTAWDQQWRLTLKNDQRYVSLRVGVIETLQGDGPFIISAEPWKNCPLPADLIGQTRPRPTV